MEFSLIPSEDSSADSGGRCALATKTLMELGFTNVTSVDMLYADWVKAGYPVAMPK